MLTHLLRKSGSSARWGASTAQADLRDLPEVLSQASEPPTLMLDFDGIEVVNQSYVKQTAAWLVHCGILARQDMNNEDWKQSADPWVARPLALQGMFVVNTSDEVRHDLDIYFRTLRLPCLEAISWNKKEVVDARILGHLDQQLLRTLECLQATGPDVVAETLWEKFKQDRIGITAWNNRLSELHARHLVNRKKQGKYWRYSAPCKEVRYGHPLHAGQG